MTPHRQRVEKTVAEPEEIRHSVFDPDCRLYLGPGPRPDLRVKVVADVVRGVIKTAHLTGREPRGKVEWSR